VSRLALSLVWLAACGPVVPPGPSPAPAPSSAAPPPRPTISQPAPDPSDPFPVPAGKPRFSRVLSSRFHLSIPLPDREGWQMIEGGRSSFLAFEHAATSSTLVTRVWQEAEAVKPALCEERARLLRPLPPRGEALAEGDVAVPAGYATHVDVGFGEGEGGTLRGYLLAFGASGRSCFAFVYATRAPAGESAASVVGDRLAVIQTVTLEGVRLKTGEDAL
jgi:hypothetical protein